MVVSLFIQTLLIIRSLSVPIGDRVSYYVSRYKDSVSIKIEKVKPSSSDWILEQTFWAFDQPVDNCIPITVYDHKHTKGHGITQYGDDNIIFWFFAYDATDHPALQHVNPVKYDVYQNNLAFYINTNTTMHSSNTLLFSFYAFEYDDKYLQNISIHNCKNCSLIPSFESEVYSYYMIVPDDVKNVYFTTIPSENVSIIYDDATYLLTEQEALEKKVNKIISHNVGSFEDPKSMNKNEIEKIMLSFYNENQIDNNTISEYMNSSLYEWISEFVEDDTTHSLIEKTFKHLSKEMTSNDANNGKETLDSDGLLHEAWTPITVDLHYDLHHYRIFVIRKAGKLDLKEFEKSMELNRNAYLKPSRQCPDISLDAIVDSEIPEWWDRARVWVVSLSVFIIMGSYICYGRYSYFKLVSAYQARDIDKGG